MWHSLQMPASGQGIAALHVYEASVEDLYAVLGGDWGESLCGVCLGLGHYLYVEFWGLGETGCCAA